MICSWKTIWEGGLGTLSVLSLAALQQSSLRAGLGPWKTKGTE